MAWSGFGANITSHKGGVLNAADTAIAVQYLQEMRNMGINRVRCHIPDYQSLSTVAQDYALAVNCKTAGMIDYNVGTSSNSFNNISFKISLSGWQTYRNIMLVNDGVNGMGVAEYAKRNGVPRLYIGNEEESHHTFKASSSHGAVQLTSSGNVATATLTQAGAVWNYTNGQQIIVGGASQSAYNGTFTITLVSNTVLQYTMGSSPGTAATGGFYIEDFTDAQLRGMLKQLATDVKTLWLGIPGPNPIICYSTPSDTGGDLSNSAAGWATETDLGGIDMLGLNVYGNGDLPTFTAAVNAFTAAFGPSGTVKPNAGFVSEWNVHQDWNSTVVQGIGPTNYEFWTAFTEEILKRYSVVRNSGLTPSFYFNYWNISVLTPDQWALKLVGTKYDKFRSSFVPGRFSQALYRMLDMKPYEIAKGSRRNSVRRIADIRPIRNANFGKCIRFNQATSMLQFTAPSSWDSNLLTTCSFGMWVYPLSISSLTTRLFDSLSAILYLYNIGFQAQFKYSSVDGLGVTGPVIPTNQWTHLFVTFDKTQANTSYPVVFVNTFELQNGGVGIASGTMNQSAGQPVTIGNRGSQDRAFDGYMQSFAMWNNAEEKNMIDHFAGKINTRGLILGLPMNETSGNLIDISGNNIPIVATDVLIGQTLPTPLPRKPV